MDIYAKIAQKVKEIAGTDKLQAGIFPAKISEVTGNTCSILVDELELTDVRLKSVIDSEENQLLITPAKGSYVLVADLSGGTFRDLAVISYSQIEKVELKIEEISLVVDKKGVVFNEGKNKGLVKIAEMIDWMEKVYSDLQTLKTQLSTHPTTGNGAVLGLVFAPQTPNPTQSTFEDTKIKH